MSVTPPQFLIKIKYLRWHICPSNEDSARFKRWLGEGDCEDDFTITSDEAQQLERWPSFKRTSAEGFYVNHCTNCGAIQDDMYLHTEPDHVFFNIFRAQPASIK